MQQRGLGSGPASGSALLFSTRNPGMAGLPAPAALRVKCHHIGTKPGAQRQASTQTVGLSEELWAREGPVLWHGQHRIEGTTCPSLRLLNSMPAASDAVTGPPQMLRSAPHGARPFSYVIERRGIPCLDMLMAVTPLSPPAPIPLSAGSAPDPPGSLLARRASDSHSFVAREESRPHSACTLSL